MEDGLLGTADVTKQKSSLLRRKACGGLCTYFGLISMGCCAIIALVIFLVVFFSVTPSMLAVALQDANVQVAELRVTRFYNDSFELALRATVGAGLPLAANVNAATLRMAIGGAEFAAVSFPELHIEAGDGAAVELPATTLATVLDPAGFTSFAVAMLTEAEVAVELRGEVHLSAFGVALPPARLATPFSLPGIANFSAVPAEVLTYDVHTTTAETIEMSASVRMRNPSTVGFSAFGALRLDVWYEGVAVGAATVASAVLLPTADNVVNASITLRRTDANAAAISALLSKSVGGREATLELTGTPDASDQPLLNPALEALRAPVRMRPLPSMPLIETSYGVLPIDYSSPALFVARNNQTLCNTSDVLFGGAYVTSNLVMSNPLSVPVVLRTLEGAATWEGEPPSGAFPGGCSTSGPDGTPYGPMLTTPTLPVQYGFALAPKASTALLSADMCLGAFDVTEGIITCYDPHGNGDFMLDHKGQRPLLLRLTLSARATGSVGNFSIWPSAPLDIHQESLPLITRVHCQNSSRC